MDSDVTKTEPTSPSILELPYEPSLVQTTLCLGNTSYDGITSDAKECNLGSPLREICTAGSARGDRHKRDDSRPVSTHHRVNHDVLMARVARRVKDKRLLRLIGRYLRGAS